jgi:hypothetical protein
MYCIKNIQDDAALLVCCADHYVIIRKLLDPIFNI